MPTVTHHAKMLDAALVRRSLARRRLDSSSVASRLGSSPHCVREFASPARRAALASAVTFAGWIAGGCVRPAPVQLSVASAARGTQARYSAGVSGRDARSLAASRRTSPSPQRPPWTLDRLDQRDQELDGRFVASATGAGVTIYIVDSGIRPTHDEFAGGRAEMGGDFVRDGRRGEDCNGHGTYMAGLAGGATYGVAKGARLVALRVADCTGQVSDTALLAALTWIADAGHVRRPAVVNLSLTVDPALVDPTVLVEMERAVRRGVASGVTFVTAAGNRSGDACELWPGRMPEVITVSATDRHDARLTTPKGGVSDGACVDLFAPGAGAPSAWWTADDDTQTLSGTSVASAYASGAAALVLEGDPSAGPDTVADSLTHSATRRRVLRAASGSPNRLLFIAGPGAQAFAVSTPLRP